MSTSSDNETGLPPANESVSMTEAPESVPMPSALPNDAAVDQATSAILAAAQAQLDTLTPTTEKPHERIPSGVDAPSENVDMANNPFSQLDKALNPNQLYISALRVTIDEFNQIAEKLPAIDMTKSPTEKQWIGEIGRALDYFHKGNVLMSRVVDITSSWAQFVEFEGVKLQAGKPRFSSPKSGDRENFLSGDRAILQINAKLGLGSSIQVPLWHSGIWLSMKAPSDSELLVLERRIADEKISLGSDTNGLIFSNASVFINNHLIDFAIAHIFDSNIKDPTTEKYKRLIRTTDLPLLEWAMACTIYPTGFPFKMPCVENPADCNYVTESKISIPRLHWTDRKALTKSQKKHMMDPNIKYSEEEILKYQGEGERGEARTIEINDNLKLVLSVPNLADYIRSGYKWIDDIKTMVEQSFGQNIQGEALDNFIWQHGVVTSMRQYGPWVKRIVLEGEGIVEDRDTVEEAMSSFSSNAEIMEKFFEGVGKYIDDSTFSLIAIPRFNCPNCGKPVSEEYTKHPHLIPIEVSKVFFTLLTQRLLRARA